MDKGCSLYDVPFLEYGEHWMKYGALAKPVMQSGSFFEVVQSNITYGQLYGNLWQTLIPQHYYKYNFLST